MATVEMMVYLRYPREGYIVTHKRETPDISPGLSPGEIPGQREGVCGVMPGRHTLIIAFPENAKRLSGISRGNNDSFILMSHLTNRRQLRRIMGYFLIDSVRQRLLGW